MKQSTWVNGWNDHRFPNFGDLSSSDLLPKTNGEDKQPSHPSRMDLERREKEKEEEEEEELELVYKGMSIGTGHQRGRLDSFFILV